MASTVQPEWVQLTEPASMTPSDIYLYFGVPPAPVDDLQKNIKKKRQFWAKRANGPGGRELADKVRKNIQNLSKVLEEGAVPEGIIPTDDGGYIVLGDPQTPQELAEQLEALLRAGNWAKVVATCQYAMETWPTSIEVLVTLALTFSELVRDFPDIAVDVKQRADQVTATALQNVSQNANVWLARARVLESNNSLVDLINLEQQSTNCGIVLAPEFQLIMSDVFFRNADEKSAVQRLINAVIISQYDPGIKSLAADKMIQCVLLPKLPLVSKKDVKAYVESVQIASWIADGVPESEAELIEFRLWATECNQRVFIGNPMFKTLLGVLTGFIALPLFVKMSSSASWQILRDGPFNKNTCMQWAEVADTAVLEELHALTPRRFEWESNLPGGRWPTQDEVFEYYNSNFTK